MKSKNKKINKKKTKNEHQEKLNTNKTEKEEKNENLKEKEIADPKQNKSPLKSIVVYHGTNQGGDMESNKGSPKIESKY